MALAKTFYSEIYDLEEKIIELNNHNLLNIYYLEYTNIKEFYIKKKQELTKEYELTGNKIMLITIETLDNIINKIDLLIKTYKEGKDIDMSELNTLLLVNQMNNQVSNKNTRIQDLKALKKQVLDDLKINYINTQNLENNDIEDDFYYGQKTA